ncbi:MAG: lipase maturation factor family protein [Parachlamydiaceae bacterium]
MISPDNYQIGIELFMRLLGLIYFFAFGAFIFQIQGLLGEKGILPMKELLNHLQYEMGRSSWFKLPSIFWFNYQDYMLKGVVIFGTAISLLLFLNLLPAPLLLLILYLLYLSIVSVGQDFLSFGWELFLLELTAQAFFLSLSPTNTFIWLSLNFLLFRFHFQGGIVKLLSKDPHWRNLTAVAYHYQSQPIPNTQAWFAHKLPLWFHKLSTLAMFIIELVIPFLLFVNLDSVRLIVFICFFGLQWMIWFTGNFSYLNHLTAVFSLLLISDVYLSTLFETPASQNPGLFLDITVSMAGLAFIALQLIVFWNHLISFNWLFHRILTKIQPWHIANRYGIFAIMTTTRCEVVIEGSQDGFVWKEYSFYFKPSEINRRPRRNSPYQPRIDWQAWFLPFTTFYQATWFQNFLFKLLHGEKSVTELLRVNPFSKTPPRYVRAILYEYKYSTLQERAAMGIWWRRTWIQQYSPTLSLQNEPKKPSY